MSGLVEKLERAAVIVERGWTQGTFARNEAGERVDMWTKEATCFCVSAALQKVDGRNRSDAWNRFDGYARKRGFRHMADFNDAPGRTQAEVAQALRQCALNLNETRHAE
jgi:hypothetical protein